MPRIRTIKPEFWSSLTVASLEPIEALTFIGLWNMADDEGRFIFDPRLVKAAVHPLRDEVTTTDVMAILSRLEACGLIVMYGAGERTIAAITGWAEHQRPNRPKPSRLPPPPGTMRDHGSRSDDAVTTHGWRTEASCSGGVRDHGAVTDGSRQEGKGREGKGREGDVVRARERTHERAGARDPHGDGGDGGGAAVGLPRQLLALIADDPHEPAVREALAKARSPLTLAAELFSWRDGMRGDPVPLPVLCRAVHDLTLAGSRVTSAGIGGFVRRLQRDGETLEAPGASPATDAWREAFLRGEGDPEGSHDPDRPGAGASGAVAGHIGGGEP
jgi:hypothetical protein